MGAHKIIRYLNVCSKICKLESERAQMKLLQKERQPLTFTHPRQLSLMQFTEQMEGRKPYT